MPPPRRPSRAPCVWGLPPGNRSVVSIGAPEGLGRPVERVASQCPSPAPPPVLCLGGSAAACPGAPHCCVGPRPPPCGPRSPGPRPRLGSSPSFVPCCLLRAEPAPGPAPCARDKGHRLSAPGEQSHPRALLAVQAGPAGGPAFWSWGTWSCTCLCCFWKHELHDAEPGLLRKQWKAPSAWCGHLSGAESGKATPHPLPHGGHRGYSQVFLTGAGQPPAREDTPGPSPVLVLLPEPAPPPGSQGAGRPSRCTLLLSSRAEVWLSHFPVPMPSTVPDASHVLRERLNETRASE